MAEAPKRMKGVGRVAFLAHRIEIAAELEAGWPIKAIYQRRADKLGMSYQQFARYVDAFMRAEKRSATPETAAAAPKPAPAIPVNAAPAPTEGSVPHARHEPAARRTFQHHGVVQEGEPEQLLGPGFLPKRRG